LVEFFIRRPIFAIVCALLIILAGAVSIPTLPIALYPDLAPPQVTVTSNYVGANAQVVEAAVTIPLEQQINGVEGMRYITSTSGNDGTSSITVTFRTGYDLNIAAVDVQNRVQAAQGVLPQAVKNTGVTITKANSNFVFATGFYCEHNEYSQQFISNYLDVYVKDSLKRIPGVGDVIIFGERKYAMRLWVDPVKLAARQLTATDVVSALSAQNVEIAAGQLGAAPTDPKQTFQISVLAAGRLTSPEQFENLVIKTTPTGIVRLSDIGRAELGSQDYSSNLKFDGIPALGMGIQQLSNANALDVDRAGKAALAELAKTFPPGLKYQVAFDTTTVVGDSIHEVIVTLGEAVILVILVIFLFLQDWRATIIPAVTIPVSLIGTFAFINLFHFSINSLTLFGITLATGLVVDDSIVVIENIQRHISEAREDNYGATSIAMKEITSAVIATSLVLIAVFVPVSFFPGTTGILYKQFSLTIAFSIAISAFNALTLSPALAAILLRKEEHKTGLMGLIFNPIDRAIKATGRGYARAVHVVLRIKTVMVVLFLAGLAATAYMYTHVPTAFVPQEDQGYLILLVLAPQGASLNYTTNIADQAQVVIAHDQDMAASFAISGFSFAGNSPNYGLIFALMKPFEQRKGATQTSAAIANRLRGELQRVPGAVIFPFEPPAIQGISPFGGFQFEIQDTGRNTLQDIDHVAHAIMRDAAARKELNPVFTQYTSTDPQLLVNVDRQKAGAMNVPFGQIDDALSVFMGSEYVNDFDFNNRSYRVYVQADQQFRQTAQDIRKFNVRSTTGQMVPLDNLVTLNQGSGPQVINHYNLFRSAELIGGEAPGYSSSQGIAALQDVAKKDLLQGMTYSWSGLALEEIESSGKTIIIFSLGLVVVYLTLSAQYESFVLPFIILLAVPMAVLGALTAINLRGTSDDVYVQIGMVMLIGLAAKNAILIVEFAEELRAQGRSIVDAAIEAAELRLRPILMTSIAFILGIFPLVLATGAGALGRRSVGTSIVGGMILSSVLNLFFIPVLYVLVKSVLARFEKKPPAPEPAIAP
jgi:HAE1 family hydrophobic/amphiphilic exporter-1